MIDCLLEELNYKKFSALEKQEKIKEMFKNAKDYENQQMSKYQKDNKDLKEQTIKGYNSHKEDPEFIR